MIQTVSYRVRSYAKHYWQMLRSYCIKRSRKQTILLTHAERTLSPSKRYGPVQFIKSLHWLTIFRILESSFISHTTMFEWSFSFRGFSTNQKYAQKFWVRIGQWEAREGKTSLSWTYFDQQYKSCIQSYEPYCMFYLRLKVKCGRL